ncbi:MAG: mucoidy inhibitor MuiA family protein, partial [Bacteroidia bacterium]
MKKLLLVIGLAQALSLFAQETKEQKITTEVKKVSVYFENAQVTREKKLTVKPGKTTLRFVDLSPYIQAKSVQAKVKGNVTVLMVNHQLNYLDKLEKSAELVKLEASYHSLEDEINVEQAHISVIDEEIIFLQENRQIGGKNQELNVANLKEASQFYSSRLTALKMGRIERQKRISDLEMKLQNMRNQMNSLYSKKEFPSGEVLISVDSKSEETISIELSYLVDNAGWYPSYDVRAKSIADPLQIVYKANVHQDTKVDWENVELILSSNNPGLSGSAPELRTYYLNYGSVPPSYKASISEVSGKVLDNQGHPIPGANVVVKGTTIGTITDMNGYFSIAIPSGATILMFSFIGYVSQEIPIQQAEIRVIMEEDITSLDEVVVTGYASEDYESSPSVARPGRASSPQIKKMETSSLALPTVQLENQTNVEFIIDMPYTVRSDSRNYVVNMTAYDVPASYEYYC